MEDSKLWEEIQTFIKGAQNKLPRNQWFYGEKMKIYIRSSWRVIEGTITNTIDLAVVEVEESHRGRGVFSRFLVQLIEAHPERVIWVESVLNPRLSVFLLARGFVKKEGIDENYYLKQNGEKEKV